MVNLRKSSRRNNFKMYLPRVISNTQIKQIRKFPGVDAVLRRHEEKWKARVKADAFLDSIKTEKSDNQNERIPNLGELKASAIPLSTSGTSRLNVELIIRWTEGPASVG
jgi:hypothetical protein